VSAGVALASVGGPACQLGSQTERTPRADAVTRVVPAQVVRVPLASLVVVVVVAVSMTVFLSGSVRQRFGARSIEQIYHIGVVAAPVPVQQYMRTPPRA
jgi:hypothetical protein